MRQDEARRETRVSIPPISLAFRLSYTTLSSPEAAVVWQGGEDLLGWKRSKRSSKKRRWKQLKRNRLVKCIASM